MKLSTLGICLLLLLAVAALARFSGSASQAANAPTTVGAMGMTQP